MIPITIPPITAQRNPSTRIPTSKNPVIHEVRPSIIAFTTMKNSPSVST